jgi:hypothetical protein
MRAGLAVVAAVRASSGGELELAALMRDQGGPGEGVVWSFTARCQGQDGNLAGGADEAVWKPRRAWMRW